jgi:hypothetical protein
LHVLYAPCAGKTWEELGVAGGIPRIRAGDTSSVARARAAHYPSRRPLLCFTDLSALKTGFTPFGETGFSC